MPRLLQCDAVVCLLANFQAFTHTPPQQKAEETKMSVRQTVLVAAALTLLAQPALAQKQYGPGVSDTEIRVGQTIAYSGPASAYGTLGKVEAAYFKWLNEAKGGINGRKINFISRDDAY